MTLKSSYETVVIIYLTSKLGLGQDWFEVPQDFLFGKTPCEVVANGCGQKVVEWLEIRLKDQYFKMNDNKANKREEE